MLNGINPSLVRYTSPLLALGVRGLGDARRAPLAAPSGTLGATFRHAVELQDALQELREAFRSRASGPVERVALSGKSLGLDMVGAVTRFDAAEEVNATPTSFSPFGPSWATGAGTSVITVDGVYTGTTDDTLTFDIQRNGIIGAITRNTNVDVYDGSGTRIDRLQIQPGDPAGKVYTLSNGLEVSFSAGTIRSNGTFEVAVSASVGSAVDPDKPFDGVRNDKPGFEYGVQVTAGSFEVNGVTIAVAADDTLQAVVDRITASVPDVTAVFDAATETVQLRRDTVGALDITVANDTSGFVAATKLSTATEVLGRLPDPERALGEIGALATVTSGVFYVNDAEVALDVSTDTLGDVIDRINAAGAGASATLEDGGQRVRITSTEGDELVLHGGTTGLFAALGLQDGTYQNQGSSQGGGVRPGPVERALERVSRALNGLVAPGPGQGPRDAAETALLAELRGAIQAGVGTDATRIRTRFGVAFDLADGAREAFSFTARDAQLLARTLARRPQDVRRFFLGSDNGQPALVDRLLDVLEVGTRTLGDKLGPLGRLIDTVA